MRPILLFTFCFLISTTALAEGPPGDSVHKDYFDNGNLKSEATYKNGSMNGPAKFYYEDGTLREEGVYKDNKAVGVLKMYDEDGTLRQETSLDDPGYIKIYDKEGNLKAESRIEGGVTVSRKEYNEDGSIKIDYQIDSDGWSVYKSYFDNGQLQTNWRHSNNFREMKSKTYNRGGVLLTEQEIKEGKIVVDKKYCQEAMEHVFVRWTPGDGDLTVKQRGHGVNDNELALLKDGGISGHLDVRGSGGISNECHPARAVFIMQGPIEDPIALPLPDKTDIVYFQNKDGWKRIPADAPVLERAIHFKPADYDPSHTHYLSDTESGAQRGASVNLNDLE